MYLIPRWFLFADLPYARVSGAIPHSTTALYGLQVALLLLEVSVIPEDEVNRDFYYFQFN